jgi:biopolymer transport protein ExbB/TolQ
MECIKVSSIVLALLSSTVFACDKPGVTEQQRENAASQQAAQQQAEAERSAQAAQAEAQQKIAAARGDFEKDRTDYRHRRDQDVSDLNKQIADLEAKARTATGKEKARLEQNMPVIRSQRDTFVNDLQRLDNVTPASWDGAKDSLDREWDALKASLDKAS